MPGDLAAHTRALLLDGRCPACAEPLGARALFGREPCSHCGAEVRAHQGGTPLADQIRERGKRQLLMIAAGVGVAHLVLGSFPLLGALVLIAAAAWIRVGILQPVSAMLSPRRRVLTRWTARLVIAAALAIAVIATELLTLVPLLGPIAKSIIGAAEVAIAAWAVTRYVHWQLDREAVDQPIEAWEYIVLVACIVGLVASVVALALAFTFLVEAFDGLLGWLQ